MYTYIPVTCAFIYYLSVTSTCALIPQTFKLTCLSQLNSYVYVYRESRQVFPKHIFCVLKFTSRNIPKACTPKNCFCVPKTQSHEHSQTYILTIYIYVSLKLSHHHVWIQKRVHKTQSSYTEIQPHVHLKQSRTSTHNITIIYTSTHNITIMYTSIHNIMYTQFSATHKPKIQAHIHVPKPQSQTPTHAHQNPSQVHLNPVVYTSNPVTCTHKPSLFPSALPHRRYARQPCRCVIQRNTKSLLAVSPTQLTRYIPPKSFIQNVQQRTQCTSKAC